MMAWGDLSVFRSLSLLSAAGAVNEATGRTTGRRDASSMYLPTRMLVSRAGGMAGRPGRVGSLCAGVLAADGVGSGVDATERGCVESIAGGCGVAGVTRRVTPVRKSGTGGSWPESVPAASDASAGMVRQEVFVVWVLGVCGLKWVCIRLGDCQRTICSYGCGLLQWVCGHCMVLCECSGLTKHWERLQCVGIMQHHVQHSKEHEKHKKHEKRRQAVGGRKGKRYLSVSTGARGRPRCIIF